MTRTTTPLQARVDGGGTPKMNGRWQIRSETGALKDVLLKTPVPPEARCSWQFELHPDAVLAPPLAMPASGLPVSLIREHTLADCGSGFRRSYLADERSITLCPATCVALPEDGFRGLEFSWTCR